MYRAQEPLFYLLTYTNDYWIRTKLFESKLDLKEISYKNCNKILQDFLRKLDDDLPKKFTITDVKYIDPYMFKKFSFVDIANQHFVIKRNSL